MLETMHVYEKYFVNNGCFIVKGVSTCELSYHPTYKLQILNLQSDCSFLTLDGTFCEWVGNKGFLKFWWIELHYNKVTIIKREGKFWEFRKGVLKATNKTIKKFPKLTNFDWNSKRTK